MRRSLLVVAAAWLCACAHGVASTGPRETAASKAATVPGEAAPSTPARDAEAAPPPASSTPATAASTPAPNAPKPSAPLPPASSAAANTADRNANAPVVAEWRVKSRGKGNLELVARVQRRALLRETLKVHVEVPPGVTVESGETDYLLLPIKEPTVDERVIRFTWVGFPGQPLLLKVDAKGETFTLHAMSDYRFGHSKLQDAPHDAKAAASATSSARPGR